MIRTNEPMIAGEESRFPWRWVALGLAASCALGIVAGMYLASGRLLPSTLAAGALGLGYALYYLRRAARADQLRGVPESTLAHALFVNAVASSHASAGDTPPSSRPAP